MRDNVRTALDRFCDWRERAGSRITRARVNVTEKYLRRQRANFAEHTAREAV